MIQSSACKSNNWYYSIWMASDGHQNSSMVNDSVFVSHSTIKHEAAMFDGTGVFYYRT